MLKLFGFQFLSYRNLSTVGGGKCRSFVAGESGGLPQPVADAPDRLDGLA
jgi:hypothetical protein